MNRSDLVRKLKLLDRYVHAIARIGAITWEEYQTDDTRRYAVEHLIERIVECGNDINNLLYFEERLSVPETYYDSFRRLPEIGLVKESIARQMASIAGMRNRLVHEYEDIDDWIVYNNIKHVKKVFPVYMEAVLQRLEPPKEAEAPES